MKRLNTMFKKYTQILYTGIFLLFLFFTNLVQGYTEKELVAEGKRQLANLMELNRQNELNGCPEKNVYVFSLIPTDNWPQYIQLNNGSKDLADSDVVALNAELVKFHEKEGNEDFGIYLCYVSDLFVNTERFFGQKTVKQIAKHYTELGTKEFDIAAASLKSTSSFFHDLLRQVMNNKVDPLIGSFDKEEAVYKEFIGRKNQIVFGEARVYSSQVKKDENGYIPELHRKRFLASTGKGMFVEKDVQPRFLEHIQNYRKSNSGSTITKDVMGTMEFVNNKMYSPNQAVQVFYLDDFGNFGQEAENATNKSYSMNDVINHNIYVYDFAGIYDVNEDSKKQKEELIALFSGTQVSSANPNKLKFFITDKNVSETDINMIENLDLTTDVHKKTVLLWIHLEAGEDVELKVRYSPDLYHDLFYKIEYTFMQKIALLPVVVAGTVAYATFKIVATAIYTAGSWISEVIENKLIIKPQYYDTSRPDYNPIYKIYFGLTMPPLGAFMLGEAITYNTLYNLYSNELNIQNSALKGDLMFAFICGLWNGIFDELKDTVKLLSGFAGIWIDDELMNKFLDTANQLSETASSEDYGLLGLMAKGIKEAHSGKTSCQLSYQIGRDAIITVTIVGGVASFFTKSSKVASTLAKLAEAIDTVSSLATYFKFGGFILKKTEGGIEFFNKLSNTSIKIKWNQVEIPNGTYFVTETEILSYINDSKYTVTLAVRIKKNPNTPSFRLQFADNSGYYDVNEVLIYHIEKELLDGTKEKSIVLAKGDKDGNFKVKKSQTERIIERLELDKTKATDVELAENLFDIPNFPTIASSADYNAFKNLITSSTWQQPDFKRKFLNDLLPETQTTGVPKFVRIRDRVKQIGDDVVESQKTDVYSIMDIWRFMMRLKKKPNSNDFEFGNTIQEGNFPIKRLRYNDLKELKQNIEKYKKSPDAEKTLLEFLTKYNSREQLILALKNNCDWCVAAILKNYRKSVIDETEKLIFAKTIAPGTNKTYEQVYLHHHYINPSNPALGFKPASDPQYVNVLDEIGIWDKSKNKVDWTNKNVEKFLKSYQSHHINPVDLFNDVGGIESTFVFMFKTLEDKIGPAKKSGNSAEVTRLENKLELRKNFFGGFKNGIMLPHKRGVNTIHASHPNYTTKIRNHMKAEKEKLEKTGDYDDDELLADALFKEAEKIAKGIREELIEQCLLGNKNVNEVLDNYTF